LVEFELQISFWITPSKTNPCRLYVSATAQPKLLLCVRLHKVLPNVDTLSLLFSLSQN